MNGAFKFVKGLLSMKLVKVKDSFYKLCKKYNVDKELLQNENGRPCVLVINMKYRGKKRDFVVPLRSNISGSVPKDQFLSLPPNTNTRQGCSHGVHYIKIFPIDKKYLDNYLISEDEYKCMIKSLLDKNEGEIILKCKDLLEKYERGIRPKFSADIDGIIAVLDSVNNDQNTSTTNTAE